MEESEERKRQEMIWKVIEEESKFMVGDDEETVMEGMKLICDLRKIALEEEVPGEEVLQTKILSQREVSKEWETWKVPAEDEIQALLNEKEAMRSINKRQLRRWFELQKEKE